MRRNIAPSNYVHPSYGAPGPYQYSAPRPRPSASTPKGSMIEVLTNSVLILTALVQITLAYQFYEVRKALNEPKADARLESMEERFSKISVVLRFLLDNTKASVQPKALERAAPNFDAQNPATDLPLARVMAQRLNLRAGPGTNHAPIMTVSAGTILVVEDLTLGDWVRVVAPNGARAYAQREQLSLSAERS